MNEISSKHTPFLTCSNKSQRCHGDVVYPLRAIHTGTISRVLNGNASDQSTSLRLSITYISRICSDETPPEVQATFYLIRKLWSYQMR